MPLYRAYLMENGHVWTAIDLTCVNDDDAKRQAANLSSGHDVELWQGDRRVTLLRLRRKSSAYSVLNSEGARWIGHLAGTRDEPPRCYPRRRPEK